MTTSKEQIGQGCQHMDLAAVLGQATQPGFLKAELLLDHPERMLNLGADMSFGGLDQILEPSIWRIRQAAAFAGPHRHSEFSFRTIHFGPFGDALVASIAVDDLLITMQRIGSWREVMHVGSRDGDRVDQA